MSEEELIETLRAFEKNRVEQLEEPAKNLFYAIMEIADERDRLNNIINELEKWIKKEIFDLTGDYDYQGVVSGYENVLDVLQELKGSDE